VAGPGQPTTWVFAAGRSVRSILGTLRADHTTLSNIITGPLLTIEGDLDGDGVFEAAGGGEIIVPRPTLPDQLRVAAATGGGEIIVPRPTLPDQLRVAASPLFVSVARSAEPDPELALPPAAAGRDGAVAVAGDRGGFARFADVAVSGHPAASGHGPPPAGRSTPSCSRTPPLEPKDPTRGV
jgi:hypothetical protein